VAQPAEVARLNQKAFQESNEALPVARIERELKGAFFDQSACLTCRATSAGCATLVGGGATCRGCAAQPEGLSREQGSFAGRAN